MLSALDYTHITRASLLALLGVLFLQREALDAFIASSWTWLREQPFIKHDSCEPILVTVCFTLYFGAWLAIDAAVPAASPWRLSQASKSDKSSWKWNGFRDSRLLNEGLWYIAPLYLLDRAFPRRRLPLEPPTALGLALQVLGGLLGYDFFFFFCHVAMHKIPPLYRLLHAKHHGGTALSAPDTIRLTLGEEIIDVLCSVLAVNLLRLHPLSRLVYNAAITALLTELHSGFDLPWSLERAVPFGWWAGSRRHWEHHREGKRYFQKFYVYLDAGMQRMGGGGEGVKLRAARARTVRGGAIANELELGKGGSGDVDVRAKRKES